MAEMSSIKWVVKIYKMENLEFLAYLTSVALSALLALTAFLAFFKLFEKLRVSFLREHKKTGSSFRELYEDNDIFNDEK